MRTALITGGTTGIGAGAARALHAAGWQVIACGLTEGECQRFTAETGIGTRQLDVTSDASVASALAGIDSLDLLVNCAGIIQRHGKEFEIDAFRQTIEVNLNGTMRMCLAAKTRLSKAGGSIVNIASIMAFRGSPYAPAYSASKGGVAQLTKSLAGAWASENIRVNAIAPGWIETDLTKPLQEDAASSGAILARTPVARWGKPDDVAGVIVFLTTHEARFVTGAVMPVDGGYLAM